MKTINYLKLGLLSFMGILLFNCGQATKEETSSPEITAPPSEPVITEVYQVEEAMNPLNVYKDKTQIFADSLNVQLYILTLEPGDSIELHTHLDHTVYVLEGGTAMVWEGGTNPVEYNLPTGVGWLGGPLTDAAKNIGDTRISLLITEIFRPRME